MAMSEPVCEELGTSIGGRIGKLRVGKGINPRARRANTRRHTHTRTFEGMPTSGRRITQAITIKMPPLIDVRINDSSIVFLLFLPHLLDEPLEHFHFSWINVLAVCQKLDE